MFSARSVKMQWACRESDPDICNFGVLRVGRTVRLSGARSNWQESPGLDGPGDFSSEAEALGYIIVRFIRPRSSAG